MRFRTRGMSAMSGEGSPGPRRYSSPRDRDAALGPRRRDRGVDLRGCGFRRHQPVLAVGPSRAQPVGEDDDEEARGGGRISISILWTSGPPPERKSTKARTGLGLMIGSCFMTAISLDRGLQDVVPVPVLDRRAQAVERNADLLGDLLVPSGVAIARGISVGCALEERVRRIS